MRRRPPVRRWFCAIFLSLLLALVAALEMGCGAMSPAPPTTTASNNSSSSNPSPSTGIPSNAQTFANLHQGAGWTGYALLPSAYAICQSCSPSGPSATWAMTQGVTAPALSGNSTQFDIGGQTAYADILWNNHLIGDFSSQGLPDTSKTLNPTLHNFIYDVNFYATDISSSQALEFDINQFVDGMSFIWGHECRIAGGHEWDIWDNLNQHWIATGVACNPTNNGWNHLVIQVQRTADDKLIFQSITLNGQTATLNQSENPTSRPNWYGITINYQQDGNFAQQPYSVWLDRLNFTYW
jgi:hypothetical protein